jgi:ribosome-associated translation inhibitor RaiA
MVKPKRVEANEPPNVPSSESSAYIVDIPADDVEAPLARSKFERTVEGLRRTFPKISEARATVKVSSPMGERRLFEVHALIRLPGRQFEFTAEGWSLAETFDKICSKLGRLRTKPERRQSYRRQPSRSEIATRTM